MRGAISILTIAALIQLARADTPVGTSFSYQGQLKQNGGPVSATADFQFSLWNAGSSGSQVGGTVSINNVTVAAGLFTVQLDFGVSPFVGSARWLQVAVRSPAGSGSFTTLSPRQALTAAPYALYSAGPWVTGSGGTLSYSAGNVGIGTDPPSWPLTITKDQAVALLTSTSNPNGSVVELKNTVSSGTLGAVNFNTLNNTYPGQIAYDTAGGMTFRAGGTERMRLTGSGRLGLGTNSPLLDLDVRGLTLLGTNGLGAGYMQTNSPAGTAIVMISSWNNNNHGAVAVCDPNGTVQANIHVDGTGHGVVEADVKNFRVANPRDPGTHIVYACIEGPEAAAYVRGTSSLIEGRAVVELPEHFQDVAVAEGMTVQVTPSSADSKGLAVVERDAAHFVVRELLDGAGSYTFDWEVKAVRIGHEHYRVIRSSSEDRPAVAAQRP